MAKQKGLVWPRQLCFYKHLQDFPESTDVTLVLATESLFPVLSRKHSSRQRTEA